MVGLLHAMAFYGASACWLSHTKNKPLQSPPKIDEIYFTTLLRQNNGRQNGH